MTAHQPLYIPWIGFFHKVICSDIFCLLDGVQFEPSSFMNRNKIKIKNGELLLTVPILMKGYLTKKTYEIQIDEKQKWQKKHWESIKLAYVKAPYFESYKNDFEEIYKKNWEKLRDLNEYIIKYFLKEFKIDVDFVRCSDLGITGNKSLRLVNICKKMDADMFIFGSGGKNYADVNLFKTEKINVYFQNYNHPIYPQLYGNFIPNLSIIDLLFNCGENSKSIIEKGNINKNDLKQIIIVKS